MPENARRVNDRVQDPKTSRNPTKLKIREETLTYTAGHMQQIRGVLLV